MSLDGRVCEVTNGSFAVAKQENRWPAVRLLWSSPAGRFGSATACRFPDLDAGQRTIRMALWNMSDDPLTTIANDQMIRS